MRRFKKAVNRGGTTLLQKTGQIERTDDGVFKAEESRYRDLEKSTNSLQKDAKQYLDAIRALSGSSSRIAATIDLFFGTESGEQAMAANAYKRAVEEMEGNITHSIVLSLPPTTPSHPRSCSPVTGRSLSRYRSRTHRQTLLLLARS